MLQPHDAMLYSCHAGIVEGDGFSEEEFHITSWEKSAATQNLKKQHIKSET